MGWLRQLIDWQRELSDPRDFIENLDTDLYVDEVFVFTPKGDVIQPRPGRPRSTSPTPSTPRSAAASAPGSTSGWCRSSTPWRRATTSRSSPGHGTPALAGLAGDRQDPQGPQQDPPGSPRSARGRHRGRQGLAGPGHAQGRPAAAEADPGRGPDGARRRHALRQPGGVLRRRRVGPDLGPGGGQPPPGRPGRSAAGGRRGDDLILERAVRQARPQPATAGWSSRAPTTSG